MPLCAVSYKALEENTKVPKKGGFKSKYLFTIFDWLFYSKITKK